MSQTSIIHEWFRRLYEENDLDVIEELMHPENLSLGLVDNPVGLESFKAVYSAFFRIWSDLQVTVLETFEEDDRVAGRWVLHGTHRATGNRLVWPGSLFARIKDGKFLECTNYLDYLDLFVQTGHFPADTLERCLGDRQVGLYLDTMAVGTLEDLQRVWERDESHFDSLFGSSAAGMVLVDAENRIQRANAAFCRQIGLNLEELRELPFSHLIHPADAAADASEFARLREGTQRAYELELRVLRREAVVWVQLSCAGPHQTSLGPRFLRGIHDITTRRLEQMVRFQEQERQMLATDLHDALAQNLALLMVQLQTATVLHGREEDRVKATLLEAHATGQRIHRELAGMMRNLRSPVAEGMDLVTALRELSEDTTDDNCRVSLTLPEERSVPPRLASLFTYRIVQEALNNARRHGCAKAIQVVLVLSDGRLKGRISDDGCGFDIKEANRSGHGLSGMQQRCDLLGGSLNLESAPGKGTTVKFELPMLELA
ncbi:MAG: ester cyclase [Candidatus Eremiobacteraeota bacterium]|nr:ester cyclase [Candidatus Eremiobacteraeota bacterium]MCW5865922.1 ester cyclase [Candidatus Eremiobacteraeota bacterium]